METIELTPGVRLSAASLGRQIQKTDRLLQRTTGKTIDRNTSRAELAAWRDMAQDALDRLKAPAVTGRVETLREARAWDGRKNHALRAGMTHAEAAAKAWAA